MKTVISTDNGFVSAHFGRCPQYTIVEIENGQLKNKDIILNPGHEPGLIPRFLIQKGVDCIIAGGMGKRAVNLFNEMNIDTILGISGEIDFVIKKHVAGTLEEGASFCSPGAGKEYGIDKSACDHD